MFRKLYQQNSLQEFIRLADNSGLVRAEVLSEVSLAVHSALESPIVSTLDRLDRLIHALIARGVLTNWQCDRLREGRWKGFFIGPFKLLDHVGVTDVGGIYLAEEIYLHRRVHLYVMPCGKQATPRPDWHFVDGTQFRVAEIA